MVEGERARVEVSYLRVRVSAHNEKKRREYMGRAQPLWQKTSRLAEEEQGGDGKTGWSSCVTDTQAESIMHTKGTPFRFRLPHGQ